MARVTVVGAGPAGLSLAAACAERGLAIRLVAPAPQQPWTNNYGLWSDEAVEAGVDDCLEKRWPDTRVRFGRGRELSLGRGYARLDNEALQRALWSRCRDHAVEVVNDRVLGVRHSTAGTELTTARGRALKTELLVDASGGRAGLLERRNAPRVAAQVAYGQLLEVSHGFDLNEMLLMDFSDEHLGEDAHRSLPTFLYAMPISERRIFLEETSLVSRPPVPFEMLEARLASRMRALGVGANRKVLEVERCFIPMGEPLPSVPQRTVGFGASAGMVHPATGYMVGQALTAAPRVAAAILQGHRAEAHPQAWAHHVWSEIWPRKNLDMHRLHRLGMEVLLNLDTSLTQDFFYRFFTHGRGWTRFLGSEPARDVMLRFFLKAGAPVRAQILRTALSSFMDTSTIYQ